MIISQYSRFRASRMVTFSRISGGAEGVALYTEKLKAELKDAMIMTNCATLTDISIDKIRIV